MNLSIIDPYQDMASRLAEKVEPQVCPLRFARDDKSKDSFGARLKACPERGRKVEPGCKGKTVDDL
jgi:hypothetical protein